LARGLDSSISEANHGWRKSGTTGGFLEEAPHG
jgi:hypothetical protein